jgi:hypothetical protein
MSTLKQAARWAFGTSEGHFALLFSSLAVCALAAAVGVPHAYEAAVALALPALTKLKS